jgi:phosphoglycolate phosphatase
VRRYIIFDLDGTLVDSNAICVQILEEMLIDRGSLRRIDPIASTRYMSLGGEQMVRALLADFCRNPSEDLAEFRTRYAARTTPRDCLYEGVTLGLKRLRQAEYVLAICSNKPANLCAKVLQDTGLAPLFSAVVGGADGLRSKPAPDLLDATLVQLNAPAEHCVFVGDSELDHAVATYAAMPFYFMSYGYSDPDWSPEQGDCFATFTNLVEHLLAMTVHGKDQ